MCNVIGGLRAARSRARNAAAFPPRREVCHEKVRASDFLLLTLARRGDYSGLRFFHVPRISELRLQCGHRGRDGSTQSITVCPATADAKDFLDGQVQFIATGYYLNQPPVTPLTNAYWGSCYQNAPTDAVAINNKGLAQCESGARGTYSIFATMQTNCLAITPCGGGCEVSGYAQLTCP
jgi:hypothetical protein